MTELRLYFPFEPKPVQSSTFSTKNGVIRNYQPSKVTSYKGQIAYSFLQQYPGFMPTDKPIFITRLWFVFPTNKGITKKDMAIVTNWEADLVVEATIPQSGFVSPMPLYKPTRPDLADNLSKGMMDALSGLLWKDDSQIVEMSGVMKCFGLKPRVELWVEY